MAKSAPTPGRQLTALLRDYTPAVRRTAQAARKKLRAQIPGATEMIYDTYNALVIGLAPGDRPSEAVLSIGLYPKWVNVYFLDGAVLDDPQKMLQGRGRRVRMLRLDGAAAVLDAPAVKALIAAAVEHADSPFDRRRARRLIVKARTARHRPRRPRG
jgi:hypothetical protein